MSNTASTFEVYEGGAFACMSCKFKGTLAEWNLATRITSWESAYAYDGGASTTFIPATYIENTYTQSNPMGALYFKDTINTYGSNTISVA